MRKNGIPCSLLFHSRSCYRYNFLRKPHQNKKYFLQQMFWTSNMISVKFEGARLSRALGSKNSLNINWGQILELPNQIIVSAKLDKVKFIYSEKATKFSEIFPLLLTTVHTVKIKGKISQNFVAFSEYMNFLITTLCN